MRRVVLPGVTALLLLVAGGACWIAGEVERDLADAGRKLARLAYAESIATSNQADHRVGRFGVLPVAAAAMAEVHEQRATAEYWLANYASLAPSRDAEGVLLERDPAMLFLAANAAYRAARAVLNPQDRPAALRLLEPVLKAYGDVMRSRPDHVDAAYNYEYIARLRELAARGKVPARARPEAQPDPPTVHGRPGDLLRAGGMSPFNVVIPKQGEEHQRGEENKDAPGASGGRANVRKG